MIVRELAVYSTGLQINWRLVDVASGRNSARQADGTAGGIDLPSRNLAATMRWRAPASTQLTMELMASNRSVPMPLRQ